MNILNWIKENKKTTITIAFIIIIIAIVPPIVIKALLEPKRIQHDKVCNNRLKNCLEVFKDPSYPLMKYKPIPSYYNNIFFADSQYPHSLSDYFYASSYKSYLPCGYNYDIVSYAPLQQVLLRGARAIHLDVFYNEKYSFDDNASVIVANTRDYKIKLISREGEQTETVRKIQTLESQCSEKYSEKCKQEEKLNNEKPDECYLTYLNFMKCLEIIRDYGWLNTNAPLFLYINMEFQTNRRLEYQIYSQIMKVLSSRLMDKFYGFQRTNIAATPFLRARNRLVLLTNKKPVNSFLDEITNGIVSTTGNVPLYEISISEATMYSCKKVGKVNDPGTVELTSRNLVTVIVPPKFDINGSNLDNDITPKIDISNYDTNLNFEIGVSLSFMYWQKFDEQKDFNNPAIKRNYLKEYLEKFKDGGMLLKPPQLRFVPKPPEKIYVRNKELDFNNITVVGHKGFMDFSI